MVKIISIISLEEVEIGTKGVSGFYGKLTGVVFTREIDLTTNNQVEVLLFILNPVFQFFRFLYIIVKFKNNEW